VKEKQNNPRRLTPEEKKALQFEREQRRQAQEAGCFGLLGGSAFSAGLKKDVWAEDSSHEDGPFICRGCLADAVLRICTEKRDHFAHHSRMSPAIVSGETELHKGCLQEICDALKARFPEGKWDVNREIPANKEKGLDKVVPDVSGRIGDKRLVIEAQASFLSIPQIIKRSEVYAKRGIPILWIVPLKEDLGDKPFRPRLYERYLHTMYFGRVYYWRPGFGTQLLPVHYGIAEREIPFSSWYDKDAEEERNAGGYDKPYKTIKRPVPADRIDIATNFYPLSRPEFRPWNERKTVPPLLIWKDKLADWWDKSEDEAFRKKFKEDNLPKERRRKQKPPIDRRYEHYDPLTGRTF
jgi:competence protein CoiA